jgi:hypothetical protein
MNKWLSPGDDWSIVHLSRGDDWSVVHLSRGDDWSVVYLSPGDDWSIVHLSRGDDWSVVHLIPTALMWARSCYHAPLPDCAKDKWWLVMSTTQGASGLQLSETPLRDGDNTARPQGDGLGYEEGMFCWKCLTTCVSLCVCASPTSFHTLNTGAHRATT